MGRRRRVWMVVRCFRNNRKLDEKRHETTGTGTVHDIGYVHDRDNDVVVSGRTPLRIMPDYSKRFRRKVRPVRMTDSCGDVGER